jgi:glycosyltransferase involved in cell wall biosynthesis
LNVFVIPSWYPSQELPIDGIFLRDQTVALAELRPDWKIGVSVWTQSEGAAWVTHPRSWLRSLRVTTVGRGPRIRRVTRNLVEFRRPTLSWTHLALAGNRGAVLRANRSNLELARAEFGAIDLIHAHVSYPAGWVAMRLSAETGIPYVLTEHTGAFPPTEFVADGKLSPLVRDPLANAAKRIAVSDALRRDIEHYGFDSIEVVPNPVDETSFSPDGSPGRSEFVFFTLASLLPMKGIDDLLDAIALLRPVEARFRIGGDGPERRRLREHARALGVEGNVEWLGRLTRPQALEEYRGCDAFVLPSRIESFGVVYVEAIACGKPIIATRCGGPESIVTRENGILVDPRDSEGLAEALQTMIAKGRSYDPAAIRAQFLERFARPAVIDALESIYRAALSAG